MQINAIVLSAGKGTRMKSDVSKQYLLVDDRPVLYYTLAAFEQSKIDDIIVVTAKEDIEFVQKEIIEKFGFCKVSKVVSGGKERYDSVIAGLAVMDDGDKVLIHDGARPLIKTEQIDEMIEEIKNCPACIAGMPVKDTIKIADEEGMVVSTPNRKFVWQIQTPQAFDVSLIKSAYDKMKEHNDTTITDDAMAVEKYTDEKIKLIMAGYENIKITTPEDLLLMKGILERRK